jgi:DNA mismatch repair protein MSH2
MKSASCLIDYLQLLDYPDNMNQYTIDTYNLSQYVRLDGSAFKALNLMPGAKDSNKYSSLYGLLNHCKTSQGSRLLSQWLKQPCTNHQDIQERLDLVQIFLDDYQLKDTLHSQLLKSIPDLCRICNRVKRNKSSLQDVIRLYQVVIKLPEFVQAIDQSQHAPQLEAAYNRFLREYTTSLQKLQEMVEETVDLAAADNHVYKIKPNFDPKLKEVDVQMENTLNQINKLYRQMANQLDLEMDKKIKLERSNAYGYCFRVTKSDAPKLRNEPGIVELSIQKTATFFTTAKLKQLSEEYEDLSTSYNTVQSALVSQVLVVTSSYCNVFEALNGLIAHLDVIISFAQAAESAPFPYVKPNILTGESDRLELRGARHPCLERQEDVSFIPNNLSMERDKKEFLIITGPNMGGKSTYIRQTAIIVLMAQIGSFVPCTQADICIFDGILARVGAGDSQLKGISTFMAEMLETSNIIKSATSRTLIVIDELGRGTSTYDGFGLAWAISEHISTNIKAFCLFATHFHELTTLKDKVPTVHNLHVTAHIDSNSRKMALLYEIREGVCDQSFGIHVAEIANCPSSVVKLAKRKVEQLEAQEQYTDHNYGLNPQQIQEGIAKMEKFKQLANSADPSQSSELKALAQEISQDPYIQKILQNF